MCEHNGAACNQQTDCGGISHCNFSGSACVTGCLQPLIITLFEPSGSDFNTTNRTADIFWYTNLAGSTQIDWGLGSSAFGCSYTNAIQNPALTFPHQVTLTNLTLGETYCYKVSSSNGSKSDYRVGAFVMPGVATPTAICGNGIIETGEQCDPPGNNVADGRCKNDATVSCDSNVECGAAGPCVPDGCSQNCQNNAIACGNGIPEAGEECDDANAVLADQCDTAGTHPLTQGPCTQTFCGDGILQSQNGEGGAEACDDGFANNSNVVPDACRATCQLPACGDDVIDSGEDCDDGDTLYSPGDTCSASCGPGLVITANAAGAITETSATITWLTSIDGDSLLEWGPVQPGPTACNYDLPNEISNAALTQSHVFPIASGLSAATQYCYRVTSTNGGLSATQLKTLTTAGGAGEICDDGVDNDNDGLCDYLASNCTDGSVPGDLDCSCTPNFSCVPGVCVADSQVVTCTDQNTCQPGYTYEQGCGACTIVCSPGQHIENCTCVSDGAYCGNQLCERPAEDEYTCPVDCPSSCLPDWECSPWGPCVNGVEERTCVDLRSCSSNLGRPDTQQSCTPGCVLTCGFAEDLNPNQCVCEQIIPFCGNNLCEVGETHDNCPEDCIGVCTPAWTTLSWGQCVNNIQTREYYDLNNCNLNLDPPPDTRACGLDCDVACGQCQQIDIAACACAPITNCCGNHSCEAGETVVSCGVDCGLPPGFHLTLTDCLDGLDNDGDGLPDYPQDPGCKTPTDGSELDLAEILENVTNFLQERIFDNPLVEDVTRAAAPLLVATVALSTFSSFSLLNLLSYLRYLFTQPVAVFARRRRRKWGIVYNSLSKRPVDLAIVRLYRQGSGQLLQSRVTDKQGRYSLLVEPGMYYLTVTKPNFIFPSNYLKGRKEDAKFLDLYHGESVTVTDKKVTITANIPLDPTEASQRSLRRVLADFYLRKVQIGVAFLAVPVAMLSFAISPNLFTGGLLGFHLTLFLLFRRLGYQKPPKSWGIVYDTKTSKPLPRAVTRIYDKTYNKLLETRVTDSKGRYAFLVDNNIYYVTAERTGYAPIKTREINLAEKKRDAFIDQDIPLHPLSGVTQSAAPQTPPPAAVPGVATEPLPPTQPTALPLSAPSDSSVGRESLQQLLERKITAQPPAVPPAPEPLPPTPAAALPPAPPSAPPAQTAAPTPPTLDKPKPPSSIFG